MQITFDAAKDKANQSKHGVPLSDAAKLEWDDALIWQDTRHDYGEARMVALGAIGERLYCVVYVVRENARRVISLRKANQREFDDYEQETN
jgi:uncharacterized DUF497 family protein